MTETATRADSPSRRRGRRSKTPRHRMTAVGILGELLITAGALVLLFFGWQLWWNDMVVAASQSDAAREISQQWMEGDGAEAGEAPGTEELTDAPVLEQPAPTTQPGTEQPATEPPVPVGDPVVAEAPDAGDPIAVLYVPRFGQDYHRTIAEGVGTSVLNSTRLGIGHYPDTQMPGELGNFAIAAHRSAYGGGMHRINELRIGDPIYVQTPDGYYTYRFRDMSYVEPTAVEVIAPVPNAPGVAPTDRIITLTSCNPLFSTDERIIAYGVFDSWQPTSAGPPKGLESIIDAQAKA